MANFNPDEPRDDEGRWSRSDGRRRKPKTFKELGKRHARKAAVVAVETGLALGATALAAHRSGLLTHMATGVKTADQALKDPHTALLFAKTITHLRR